MFSKRVSRTELIKLANLYFLRRMSIVFVDRTSVGGGIETFESYLFPRLPLFFDYSAFALMGLNDNDYIVTGSIRIPNDFAYNKGGFAYAWVEFTYDGKQYVFDSSYKNVVPKSTWYSKHKPKISKKLSKSMILSLILTPETSTSTMVLDTNMVLINSNVKQKISAPYNTIASLYRNCRFEITGEKIKKFTAYSDVQYSQYGN